MDANSAASGRLTASSETYSPFSSIAADETLEKETAALLAREAVLEDGARELAG